MKQYVLSIISDNYNEGCGVMVGDMFITAGHVISKCENPRIRWNGKRIALINPIVFHNDENDSDGYDIAVYSVPNANSPLVLSDVVPEKGDVLKSCSWRMLGEEYVECNTVVNGLKDGNYYASSLISIKYASLNSTSLNLNASSNEFGIMILLFSVI
jgi:hypothetical protein